MLHLIVDYYRYILWTMILYLYGSKRNQTDAWAWMDWHISILIDVINVGMCSNIAFRFLARNLACRNNDEKWLLYPNVYSRNRRCRKMHPFLFIASVLVKITRFLCIQIFLWVDNSIADLICYTIIHNTNICLESLFDFMIDENYSFSL